MSSMFNCFNAQKQFFLYRIFSPWVFHFVPLFMWNEFSYCFSRNISWEYIKSLDNQCYFLLPLHKRKMAEFAIVLSQFFWLNVLFKKIKVELIYNVGLSNCFLFFQFYFSFFSFLFLLFDINRRNLKPTRFIFLCFLHQFLMAIYRITI